MSELQLWEWAQKNKAPTNPSPLYEAVLIATVKLPDGLGGLCFGVMLASRANNGGSITTCAQTFPEGESYQYAYARIWEQVPKDGIMLRPINKIVPATTTTRGPNTGRLQVREFFDGPIEQVDLAVATGTDRGGLVSVNGFSRIPRFERCDIGLFKDMQTNPQTALNLVTGKRVPYVGQSELQHGFVTRALATPFEVAHQGVPYLYDDGLISISKGEASVDLPAAGNQPAQTVSLTVGVAFAPGIR
ncbi:MAG: hypothetical protein V4519_04270 [Patescibacteria group bacterium]